MSYSQIKVNLWGKSYSAYLHNDLLSVGNFGDAPSDVKIGNKVYKVIESVLDERDDIWELKLAMASAKPGEKLDSKSTKGKC